MSKTSGVFKFQRGDKVGAVDAEHDKKFLDACFVDNGDISKLIDCTHPECIIVGRTGSGKSALILELEKRAAGRTPGATGVSPVLLATDACTCNGVLRSWRGKRCSSPVGSKHPSKSDRLLGGDH